jgi:hypothetical protein
MHPLINQIEQLFLPEMQRLASDLQEQYPALQFKVWRGPVESLTKYQGYALGVDCLFPKVTQNATNNVSLCVDVCSLTSAPRLMAEVGWGNLPVNRRRHSETTCNRAMTGRKQHRKLLRNSRRLFQA